MSEKKILCAEKLKKSYRLGKTRIKVLRGLDMRVERGEFVCIVGASGSGKSTLLHILGSLDKPDDGKVFYDGCDIGSLGNAKLNAFRNRTVGFVFQFYHLLEELSVLENVLIPAMTAKSVAGWLIARNSARKRALELLRSVGLSDRAKHKPSQLSGGERQRTAICRALMNSPELLLADEPTGNLDSETGNSILGIFERLNKAGQTIVMVTHDERIASRAHRTIRLADGRIGPG
jgi:ABC-type lipoprotein export system ATPase subunit